MMTHPNDNEPSDDKRPTARQVMRVETRKKRGRSPGIAAPPGITDRSDKEDAQDQQSSEGPSSQSQLPADAAPVAEPSSNEECPTPDGALAEESFVPLEDIPYEPAQYQGLTFLDRIGVSIVVAPAGVATFGMSQFLSGYLAGRIWGPFGYCRYPGEVLFSTYTPNLDRSMRAAHANLIGGHRVLVQRTAKPFDWHNPLDSLTEQLSAIDMTKVAGVIFDTGPFPKHVKESTVRITCATLNEFAEKHEVIVLLQVESNSTAEDPYDRVPQNLRGLRGSLLIAPLAPKTISAPQGAALEFLLMRLTPSSPQALTVRFNLHQPWDNVETTRIGWGAPAMDDPRTAIRRAVRADVTQAEMVAIQLAHAVIQRNNRETTSAELKAAGKLHTPEIAPTTMRDALSTASLMGWLKKHRSYEGQWYWVIPGITPIRGWSSGPPDGLPF